MGFTLDFIRMFSIELLYAAPLLLSLMLIIVILGHIVGRLEGWSKSDSLYYSFVTATTVGYGDFRPSKKMAKLLAVIIAFIGLVFTGIIVAIAINSATHAFKTTYNATKILEQVYK